MNAEKQFELIISVEIKFRGKTAAQRAKHIEALMKLLDKRTRFYKLESFYKLDSFRSGEE